MQITKKVFLAIIIVMLSIFLVFVFLPIYRIYEFLGESENEN